MNGTCTCTETHSGQSGEWVWIRPLEGLFAGRWHHKMTWWDQGLSMHVYTHTHTHTHTQAHTHPHIKSSPTLLAPEAVSGSLGENKTNSVMACQKEAGK